MTVLKANLNPQISNGLLLSAGIHLFIIIFFAFTFPAPKENFQPKLFFLGSILKKQDVVAHSTFQNKKINRVTEPITLFESKLSQDAFTTTKPPSGYLLPREPKSITKSTFPVTNNNQTKKPTKISDPESNLPETSYQPLKLYPHD